MDQNLRVLFEQALSNEPTLPTGNLTQEAMVGGAGLRRRRRLLAGGGAAGMVAVVATIVALNMTARPDETAPPVVAAAALMPPVNAACTLPARGEATDVRIFLRADLTDEQRLDLHTALQSDPLVRRATFESREQAYARFREFHKNSPELIKAVTVDRFPESFHIELAEPSEYTTFVAGYKSARGVDEILGTTCPNGSPSGEGR
ncbi:hypothetical protein GA0074692_0184 [Micromonospora pallida]|uniref:FtsX extracellular domain-containing protein n=1 Tax=Micromonospora pallida TaxID=145854 RepID=A0A1C6RKF3_9ACTN|nr:permease-like cell division protein FtsX [Micromonospora pallida]SCL17505.1 hypothetical protein GA0074692_0184 [Micromonospora pallida]